MTIAKKNGKKSIGFIDAKARVSLLVAAGATWRKADFSKRAKTARARNVKSVKINWIFQ